MEQERGRRMLGRGLFTITDTAFYLVTTENAVQKLVEAEAIPHHRIGRRLYFLQRELDEWLEKSPGVSVKTAIAAKSGVNESVDTGPSPRPARTSWRPDHDPAEPVVIVRRPAEPRQRQKGTG